MIVVSFTLPQSGGISALLCFIAFVSLPGIRFPASLDEGGGAGNDCGNRSLRAMADLKFLLAARISDTLALDYADLRLISHISGPRQKPISYNEIYIIMKIFQNFRNAWVKATTLGFFSFLLMMPIGFIFTELFHPLKSEGLTLPEIFNQRMAKSPLEFGWRYFIITQLEHFILYVIVGAVLSHLQYKVLKEYIPNKLKWTFLTILGLELILLGDLLYAGLSTGGAPGPLEPLLIGLGGGGLMALMQFLYLRSRGVKSARWVGWWILGIVTGILTSIIFIFTYEYFFIDSIKQAVSPMVFLVIDWLSFILPYFTLIGFFAGLFSARSLYRSLQPLKT